MLLRCCSFWTFCSWKCPHSWRTIDDLSDEKMQKMKYFYSGCQNEKSLKQVSEFFKSTQVYKSFITWRCWNSELGNNCSESRLHVVVIYVHCDINLLWIIILSCRVIWSYCLMCIMSNIDQSLRNVPTNWKIWTFLTGMSEENQILIWLMCLICSLIHCRLFACRRWVKKVLPVNSV